jgi:hypothetical protein
VPHLEGVAHFKNNQFKKRLAGETTISITDVKKKISLFQLIQIVLVAGIIILSVCRFN